MMNNTISIPLVLLSILLEINQSGILNEISCDSISESFQKGKYTFKSYLNDTEKNGTILQTNKEVTYHIFDYSNKTVTFIAKSKSSGEWTKQSFTFDSYNEDGEYIVLVCKGQAVNEIWASMEGTNLGYDFYNGLRMAFYELEVVE